MARPVQHVLRWVKPIAIPRIQLYILGLQVVSYIALQSNPEMFVNLLPFDRGRILEGEVWRLFTWFFIPPAHSPLWTLIYFWIFFSFSHIVEFRIGTIHNSSFYYLSWFLTVILCFITGMGIYTNFFMSLMVFLIYCGYFYRETIYMFGLIPVPVKYMAPFTWIVFFLFIGLSQQIAYGIGFLATYMILYGMPFAEIQTQVVATPIKKAKKKIVAVHRCEECSITEIESADEDFRVCHMCGKEFCEQHLSTHRHD